VLELAAQKKQPIDKIRILGSPRAFIGHNIREAQLFQAGITAEKIADEVKEMACRVERVGSTELTEVSHPNRGGSNSGVSSQDARDTSL
jgi:hypothetical protein